MNTNFSTNRIISTLQQLLNPDSLTVNGDTTITGDLQIDGDLRVDTTTMFVNQSNGRVGIGTDNPLSDLHVHSESSPVEMIVRSNSGGSSIIIDRETSTNEGSIEFRTNNTLNWFIGIDNSPPSYTNDLVIKTSDNGSPLIDFTTGGNLYVLSGNVGIGTTDPEEKLHVEGNSFVDNGNFVVGTGSMGVGIGTDTPVKILEVRSSDSGVLFPNMSTTERDLISSPQSGEVIYNFSTNKLQCYDGTSWNDLF